MKISRHSLEAEQPWYSIHSILPVFLRLGLGGVFLDSGMGKLFHLNVFFGKVAEYHILSPVIAYGFGAFLPWVEALAGLYLIFGLFIRFSAVLTLAMLASFLVAAVIVIIRGDTVDCGCFIGGSLPDHTSGRHSYVGWPLFFRDLLMFIAAGYLCWRWESPWSLDRWLNSDTNRR